MSGTSSSFGSVSVHMGSDARITCHTYPDKPGTGPILAVDAGDVALTLHVRTHRSVVAADVTNARALAEAVGVYLAECERAYRETHPESETADDNRAAGCARTDERDAAA